MPRDSFRTKVLKPRRESSKTKVFLNFAVSNNQPRRQKVDSTWMSSLMILKDEMKFLSTLFFVLFFVSQASFAAISNEKRLIEIQKLLEERKKKTSNLTQSSVIFDLPVTYNDRVSYWIKSFQGPGKAWFADWLEKATRYMPSIQQALKKNNLPQDLAFMVMIESGFNAHAVSSAAAVGPWQFIETTGARYGLKKNYWLDERRDLRKSTNAAIRYISDLYKEFGSWYLVAASYNMGENGLRRQIKKHKSYDFWELSRRKAIPKETIDYVPKIIAAMMITKSPGIYGFTDLAFMDPLEYEILYAPGGTNLRTLADSLSVTQKSIIDLNAELTQGKIPPTVSFHPIRVPKGAGKLALAALKKQQQASLDSNKIYR